MRHLAEHPAHRRIVRNLADAPDLLEPERAQRRLLGLVEADAAPDLLDRDRLLLGGGGHDPDSSPRSWTSLPRRFATCSAFRSHLSPSRVARRTVLGFAVPSDFVRMSWTPHDSRTARTAPPAMTPVPGDAGFRSTCPEPNRPTTGCGIVEPLSGM